MQSTIPKRKLPRLVKAVSLAAHDHMVCVLTDEIERVAGQVHADIILGVACGGVARGAR